MLSIEIQTGVRHEHRALQKYLDQKGLILIQPPEGRFESSDRLDGLASHQHTTNAGHRCPLSFQREAEERWRLDERIGRDTDVTFMVESAVIRFVRPAIPVLRGSIHHTGRRMSFEEGDLLL